MNNKRQPRSLNFLKCTRCRKDRQKVCARSMSDCSCERFLKSFLVYSTRSLMAQPAMRSLHQIRIPMLGELHCQRSIARIPSSSRGSRLKCSGQGLAELELACRQRPHHPKPTTENRLYCIRKFSSPTLFWRHI